MHKVLNKKENIVCFALFVSFIPYLFLDENIVPEVIHFSGLLNIFSSIVFYKKRYFLDCEINNRLKRIETIMALFMTFVFSICLSLIRVFSSPLCNFSFLKDFFHSPFISFMIVLWTLMFFVPVSIFSIYVIVQLSIRTVMNHNRFSVFIHDNEGVSNIKEFIICFSIIIGLSIAFLFSTYPGIWLNDDVMTVQYMALSNIWHHWHTLGYLLFVKQLISHSLNTFPVNIAQTIIWIFIQFYILFSLKNNRKCMFLYTFVSIIIFTPYNYLEVMIKDTVYAMGVLCLTVVIYNIIRNGKISILDYLAGIIGVLMSSLFRHGGVFVVSASLVILFIYCLVHNEKQIKLIISIILLVVSVVSYCLVNITFSDSVNAEKNPSYIKYSTPLQMISAAAHEGFEFKDEEIEEIEKFMPLEDLAGLYNPYWSDSVAREWGNPNIEKISPLIETQDYGKTLILLNAKILFRNPVLYIKSLAKIDSIILEVTTPSDAHDFFAGPVCEAPKESFIYYSNFYNYTDGFTRLTNKLSFLIPFYWRGGIFFAGLIFSICIFSIGKNKKYLIILLPAFFNTGLLLLACPTQDPRYILPIMEVILFVFAVIPFSVVTDINISNPEKE